MPKPIKMKLNRILIVTSAIIVGGATGYLLYVRWERRKVDKIIVSEREALDIINNPNLK